MIRFMLAIVAICATFALAACTTVSTDNPIGVSAGAVEDARLAGNWKVVPAKDSTDEAYIFLMPRDAGAYEGLLVIASEKEWWAGDVVAGRTGMATMLNIRPRLKNGETPPNNDVPQGYFPLRYEVGADGQLNLFIWSADALKEAVEQGRIAGAIDKGDIRITADSRTLDTFFAETAPAIFSVPYATLERLK